MSSIKKIEKIEKIDEKEEKEGFRNYIDERELEEGDDIGDKHPTTYIGKFYKCNHTCQNLEYVLKCKKKYYKFNNAEHTIMELFKMSDEIYDESDPDLTLSQLQHAIQVGERLRNKFTDPEYDWLWFTGFIHDLGKILAFWLPQWSVVGDTFPVGCRFDETNIFYPYFKKNNDFGKYDKYGIYKEGCGFDKLHFSFSHDDYLSKVLEYNGHSLPEEAIYLIRYHSFYPWHSRGGYSWFASEKDHKMKSLLKEFQKCDLYSKDNEGKVYDYEELTKFYKKLADKYLGENKILKL